MDRTLDDLIYKYFITRAFATNIPTTLLGSPVVSIYENDSDVQITAGITLGVDHDGITGLNVVTIDTSAAGYESDKDYSLIITAGTVDGVSWVGQPVGEFTLDKIAIGVWDRKLTGALHNIATSAGRRLRGLQDFGNYLGSIHVDTLNGTAGVVIDENGTVDNPVLTWADALTLNATLGFNSFTMRAGSTILLTGNSDGYELLGNSWILQLESQSISAAFIANATVSGIGTGANRPTFVNCFLGTMTIVPLHALICGLSGTITFSAAGDYTFVSCYSDIAGASTPIIDTGATVANVNLTMPHYDQGIEIRNLNNLGADEFSISGNGQIIYAASSSGAVNQRSDWKVTNTGGVTITTDDNTAGIADKTGYSLAATGLDLIVSTATGMIEIAKAIWDRALTAANHNITTSAGRRVRQLTDVVIIDGTSPDTGGTANTAIRIELDSAASAVNGTYDPATVMIVEGTGAGQSRQIFEYDGPNRFAYINRDWKTIPDDTAVYVIMAHSGDTHVNEGVVRGGTSTTITLNALADSEDGTYVGQNIFLFAGIGQDQSRAIIAYDGESKVAIIARPWNTIPVDGETIYGILPTGDPTTLGEQLDTIDTILDAVLALLDDPRAEPGQGKPPENPDAMTKLDYIYKTWRNKKDNDGNTTQLYADDGSTVDQKQTTSVAGGIVEKAEWESGP